MTAGSFFNLIQQKSSTSINGGTNTRMHFNQRESKLPVADASLSIQKDLLIRGAQAKVAASWMCLNFCKERRN